MTDLEYSADLTREYLSSIDLSDIQEIKKRKEEIDPKEEEAIAIEASKFYKNYFEEELKLFIQAQLEFIAKDVNNESKLQFARGTFNGLCLIRDWFEKQERLSTPDRVKEEEQSKYPTGL